MDFKDRTELVDAITSLTLATRTVTTVLRESFPDDERLKNIEGEFDSVFKRLNSLMSRIDNDIQERRERKLREWGNG